DDHVAETLGGGDLVAAIARSSARGAVIAIDDASWIAPATLRALERALAPDVVALAVITTSAAAIGDREAGHRIDVVLPTLMYEDAEVLLRELLRPARLIPGVLVERHLVHHRAFRYWLDRPEVDAIARLARVAYHGAGAQEPITAAVCWIGLARAARDRGDGDAAEQVLDRALGCLTGAPRLRA